MAFCVYFVSKVYYGVKFCPSCGTAIDAAEQKTEQTEQPKQGAQNDFAEKLQNLNNTADTTADFDAADIEQNAEGSESQTVACSEKSRFTCG